MSSAPEAFSISSSESAMSTIIFFSFSPNV
jgi:hypothetical protein